MKSIDYRPEIDGLRAFAVIPVVLFHMDFGWMRGGFIGVDVFFVISGFLITSILLKDFDSNSFTFRKFWARRIRRILPALITVLIACFVVEELFAFRGHHHAFGIQSLAALTSLANIYFYKSVGDYWGNEAEGSPLLHTWSLSLEEQFYLVFPVAIWLIMRYKPRWLSGLLLSAVAISLYAFLYCTLFHPTAAFYLLPARAWELAAGCYLATIYPRISEFNTNSKSFDSLALVGLALILTSICLVPQLDGGLVIGVLGTLLVLGFCRAGICKAILSFLPLVIIGKISYSLYLWHWPVLVFAEYFGIEISQWVLMGIILILSLLSYRFVEIPFRERKRLLPLIGLTYATAIGLSCTAIFSERNYDTSDYAQVTAYGLYYNLQPDHQMDESYKESVATSTVPERTSPLDAYLNGGWIRGEGDSYPQVVVLGDSHGVMWSDAIHTVVEELGLKTSFYSMNSLSPFIHFPLNSNQEGSILTPQQKLAYDKARLEFIKLWKPKIVIVGARWSLYPRYAAEDLLDFLQEHVPTVLLIEQPPELDLKPMINVQQYLCYKNLKPEKEVKRYWPERKSKVLAASREDFRRLVEHYKNCDAIPTYDLFSSGDQVLILDGKDTLYLDHNHLTNLGAKLAIPRIREKIRNSMP